MPPFHINRMKLQFFQFGYVENPQSKPWKGLKTGFWYPQSSLCWKRLDGIHEKPQHRTNNTVFPSLIWSNRPHDTPVLLVLIPQKGLKEIFNNPLGALEVLWPILYYDLNWKCNGLACIKVMKLHPGLILEFVNLIQLVLSRKWLIPFERGGQLHMTICHCMVLFTF